MEITFRPAAPGDFAAITDLINRANSWEPPLTGVAREHRGRKLGLAVKVEGLRRAKEFGLPSVRTDNHTANAPMLAINATLGFQPLPGFVSFGRSLS